MVSCEGYTKSLRVRFKNQNSLFSLEIGCFLQKQDKSVGPAGFEPATKRLWQAGRSVKYVFYILLCGKNNKMDSERGRHGLVLNKVFCNQGTRTEFELHTSWVWPVTSINS